MSRHRLTSLRRHSLSGSNKGSVWDLYATNGFLRPITNANSSVKWVEDLDGTLVQSPANKPAMPGMRLTDGVWYPTASDGSLISPISRMIRTAQGSVAEYDETYPGVLVEPAATNKCTCRKVNPTDTTNMVLYGDVAATLTLVSDTAALTAAGLIGLCTSGNVYKLDNSGGSTAAYVLCGGTVANTNSHSAGIFARGAGKLYIVGSLNSGTVFNLAIYEQAQNLNITPTSTSAQLGVYCTAGQVAYFIMPELVESSFLTSPIMPKPTEDTLAAVTRAADNVTFATPSWLLAHPNDFAVIGTVIPKTSVVGTVYALSLYQDASNYLGIYLNASAGALTAVKRYAGTSIYLLASTQTVNIPNQYIFYQSALLGCGKASRTYADGAWGDWSTWRTNADATGKGPVMASSFALGNLNSSLYLYSTMPMTRILRIPTNLSAAALQAWLVAKAGE